MTSFLDLVETWQADRVPMEAVPPDAHALVAFPVNEETVGLAGIRVVSLKSVPFPAAAWKPENAKEPMRIQAWKLDA
jgi:hypothetical protein